jgi:hypothetical protein
MSETIFRKVMCSERLPEKEGHYITNCGYLLFCTNWAYIDIEVSYWLEEIEINTIKAEAWEDGMKAHANKLFDCAQLVIDEPNNPYK